MYRNARNNFAILILPVMGMALFSVSVFAESSGNSPAPSYVATGNPGAAKAFNPDVSVNFLGYARRGSNNSGQLIGRTSDVHDGFTFQEAEMQFFADVDPYFRANALFSLSPKEDVGLNHAVNPATPTGSPGFGLDPEEVFFESINLPMVAFRGGKFKAALGKHNTLHTHAYPFVDAPLINQDLLGGEGLNETGVSAAVLVPVSWFMEATVQGLNNNNAVLYNSANSGDITGVVQLRNLWDLSDDWTLEITPFGTTGKNQYASTSSLVGSDLIFKWRPAVGGKYNALIFANEYMQGHIGGNPAGENLGGIASWVQYQFAERWWVQGRGEFEGMNHSAGLPLKRKQSALLGFYPSEFSGFRLQYDHLVADNTTTEHAVTLQWNITIGAHPAHMY